MNPLTNVRNIKKLNEQELKLGIFDERRSWHNQYKDSAYIFVGGLPYELTEGDIICVFSQYGEIVNINLVRDKKTGKSKGYGFIAYEDQRSTILAVDNLNSIKLGGRTIRVDHVEEYRRPKSDEKDESGKYKDKIEVGCAPKIEESPSSDSQDEQNQAPVEKIKKKHKKDKKSKKKKKKRAVEHDESDAESNEPKIKRPKEGVKTEYEKSEPIRESYKSRDWKNPEPAEPRRRSRSPSPSRRRSHSPSPSRRRSHSPSPSRRRSHSPSPSRKHGHSRKGKTGLGERERDKYDDRRYESKRSRERERSEHSSTYTKYDQRSPRRNR